MFELLTTPRNPPQSQFPHLECIVILELKLRL